MHLSELLLPWAEPIYDAGAVMAIYVGVTFAGSHDHGLLLHDDLDQWQEGRPLAHAVVPAVHRSESRHALHGHPEQSWHPATTHRQAAEGVAGQRRG